MMILVRDVFRARFGKGDELVALFKDARSQWSTKFTDAQILTDASGPFFTVVTETRLESLAEWERYTAETFSHPEFGTWFARMTALVESGRREFYHVED